MLSMQMAGVKSRIVAEAAPLLKVGGATKVTNFASCPMTSILVLARLLRVNFRVTSSE